MKPMTCRHCGQVYEDIDSDEIGVYNRLLSYYICHGWFVVYVDVLFCDTCQEETIRYHEEVPDGLEIVDPIEGEDDHPVWYGGI